VLILCALAMLTEYIYVVKGIYIHIALYPLKERDQQSTAPLSVRPFVAHSNRDSCILDTHGGLVAGYQVLYDAVTSNVHIARIEKPILVSLPY